MLRTWPKAERAMAGSLRRYGQMSPVVRRYPKITVRRIWEELQGHDYSGGYSILCERVAQLRPQPQTPWIERFEAG